MYLKEINLNRINLNQEIRKYNIKENARLRITPKMKCNKTQCTEICRPQSKTRTATTKQRSTRTEQPSHQAEKATARGINPERSEVWIKETARGNPERIKLNLI